MSRHNKQLHCKVCGYIWFRELSSRATNPLPLRCPSKSCRSRHWNDEYSRPDEWQRFMQYVDITDSGCWLWRGALSTGGYGQFRMDGSGDTNVGAHRYSYQHFVEDTSRLLHHLCHTRPCVNPLHLRPVSSSQHKQLHPQTPKTICLRGHHLSGSNVRFNKAGQRWCRACDRVRHRAYYAAKKRDAS